MSDALLLLVLALGAVVGARLATRWPPRSRGSARASWAALVLRSSALVVAMAYGASKLWFTTTHLAPPARWLIGLGAALLLPWFGNAVAGLWFLLRVGPAKLNGSLAVQGHSGRVRQIGLTRLVLVESGEREVLLPYLGLAWRPLVLSPVAATGASRIVLQRESWSEEQRRFLLQAAILSPYRDVSCPVSVNISGSQANVAISPLRPDALELLERSLERALVEWEHAEIEPATQVRQPER
jgi:hypothetical protein